MQRTITAALVLATLGIAQAAPVPPAIAPFIEEDSDPHVITGNFGPAKDTMIVVWWDMMGVGSFPAFALVPDAKAKHGYKKLPVAKLPVGSINGEIKTALIANLDKDPADELVLELGVQRSGGTHTYGTVEYAVLDWNGKSFVRVPALERKLEAKMRARESFADPLSDADLRAALGVKK